MNSNNRKYIIAGLIGIVTIFGALAYLQFKKIMNYTLGFKGIKVRSISKDLISIDVFLNYTNKADIDITLVEQEYKVFLNNNYVTRASNGSSNLVKANSTSPIGVNVAFDPKNVLNVLNKSYAELLLDPGKITLKVDIKLKVKVVGIKVNIPFTLNTTLKEILKPQQPTT
jgi:LEA14-like dessication related protein